MAEQIRTEVGPWSLVPEWVLDLPVSDRALRLYALLGRYADDKTKKCYPSRKTLAERLACSVSSLDRSMKELEEHGAVIVQRRKDEAGDWTSNMYTVAQVNRGGGTGEATGGGTGDATGGVTGDERTRTTSNENQLNDKPAASPPKKPTFTKAQRDAIFDELVKIFGDASTADRQSMYGQAVTQLLTAGATPGQVARRGHVLLSKGWDDCTPKALTKHWDALANARRVRGEVGGGPNDWAANL